MPQAVDLNVKNGATPPVDKTFTLISPAAGDGGIAKWALKEGVISSVFPTYTLSAEATKNNSRKARGNIHVPSSYTDTVTGRTFVASGADFNFSASVPNDFPENLKADWVAYVTNLVNHALTKAVIRDAVPAT